MKEKVLSISIDMGFKHNGIYYASLEKVDDESNEYIIKDKSATCISLEEKNIKYSKASRRAKRHITANYQREKLAKRLFDEIINIDDYEPKQQEKLHGLFKNRGFTYLTSSDEFEEVSEEYKEHMEAKEPNSILIGLYTIDNIEDKINEYSHSEDELKKYIDDVSKEIERILAPYEEYKKQREELKNLGKEYKHLKSPLDDKVRKSLKAINDIFLSYKKEITLGQKPRAKYFEEIRGIIDKIDYVENFTKDELYKIVCNISNLQLRCLRKYFNGKYDKEFNNKLLGEKIYKFYISRHYKKDKEKKELKDNIKRYIKTLEQDKDGLNFLKTADPECTIPPMEDMNNRYGNKCNVLLIKDEKIDDDIKKCLELIYSKEIFIDHNGEVIENIDYFQDKKKGKIDYEKAFKRFADYSLKMINEEKANKQGFISESSHPRKVFTNDNDYEADFKTFYFKGYEKEYEKFRELLRKYYIEEEKILKGIYNEETSIFRPCNCNTPYKNNVKHMLIEPLFRDMNCKFNKSDVEEFAKEIYTKKYSGNSKIYNFIEKVSEQAKEDKNKFFANVEDAYNKYEENNKKDVKNSDISFSFRDLEQVLKAIADILYDMGKISEEAKNEFSVLNKDTLKNRVNILKQLFDILDKDIKGYYKTCETHTKENEARSQVYKNKFGHAIYKRLLSRVSKPIDGIIDMHLDRLAYDIIENIPKNINIADFNKLEINIEENRFCFEEDLKQVKKANPSNNPKKKKKEKKKDYICPYNGNLVNQRDGDYDHILPRSGSFGIFNSKANLIYCSTDGNQREKANKEYSLKDLHEKHLKSIFKTDNYNKIVEFIEEHLNTIDTKNYTNFDNLNNNQQKAFRYALFLHGENNKLFDKALNLLKQDKLKTTTNGTQKRLISLIYKKALSKNNKLECSANVVESMLVRAVRNELSEQDEGLKKHEKQDNHSHCIDASVVFHLSHSNASNKSIQSRRAKETDKIIYNFNYLNDIYLEESSIALIEKKRKFLTLDKSKDDMGSIKYFDDTIYSIYIEPFKYTDNKKDLNNINILINYQLLYKNIKGKKAFISSIEDINKNDFLWVDKEKYFDLIFHLFCDGNIKELEKLKFLDKNISSRTRKDVRDLVFKDGSDKKKIKYILQDKNDKKLSELLDKNKALLELYNRLENALKDIPKEDEYKEEREKIYEEVCKQFFNPKDTKRTRKTRRIYSLEVKGQANYIVKRKNNTYQAVKGQDIATPTYIINDDLVQIKFYSKNTLPLRINELLNILKYKDSNKKPIYEKEIDNIGEYDLEAKKYIKYLKYTFSESGRARVFVILNKSAFENIDFNNITENRSYNIKDENIALLIKDYIDNKGCPIYRFIGRPREDGKQIKVIKQNLDTITLEYPKSIDKKFNELVKEIYETSSN